MRDSRHQRSVVTRTCRSIYLSSARTTSDWAVTTREDLVFRTRTIGGTWWGGFYDGTRKQTGVGLTLKPSSHLAIALRADRNDVDLKEGRFSTQVLTARADYSFTPNVTWQNLELYDNESKVLSYQSRFRWILKPGNDLFIVVNRGWVQNLDGRFDSIFERASSKVQYTFRF